LLTLTEKFSIGDVIRAATKPKKRKRLEKMLMKSRPVARDAEIKGRVGIGLVSAPGGTAMADEHYFVMMVECQHCKTKQKVHVAAQTGVVQMANPAIICISCNKHFRVTVPDKILRGPFPV
jgi:hypothetical protein